MLWDVMVRSGALYHKEDKNLDNFREWLSDNLRYFMLGGAILIIVVVLFFGVRALVGSNRGNSEKEPNTTSENQGNVPSSPTKEGESDDEKKEDANPMETNNADISALIRSYYKALGEQDIATLKTLEDDLTPSDEAKITNAKEYIEGYEVRDVYTKKGLTDDSYVVYASFYYICQGIETKVPALSWLYVYKDSAGKLIIDNDAQQNAKISAYVDRLSGDEDVKKLLADANDEYDQAQVEDPALAEFLDGLGEDASMTGAESGTMFTASDACNVRAAADMEAEVLGVISAGTQVESKGVDGEWTQIEYEGQTGYIYSSLLEAN